MKRPMVQPIADDRWRNIVIDVFGPMPARTLAEVTALRGVKKARAQYETGHPDVTLRMLTLARNEFNRRATA